MSRRPPLTDRAIAESLGEDRDAPPDLARSISAYVRTTPQRPGSPFVGLLGLRPAFAGWRLLAVTLLLLLTLVALGLATLSGSRPRLSVILPSLGPSVAPTLVPTPSIGPPWPAGWSHIADIPREDGDAVVAELDGQVVIANAARGELAFLDPAAGEGGRIVQRLALGPTSRGLSMFRGSDRWLIGLDGAGELVLFDPLTRLMERRIAISGDPYNIASAGQIVYVADFGRGQLLRVDRSTDEVTAAIELEQAAGVAVLDDGSVLVATRPGRLVKVDPVSLTTIEEATIQGDVMTLIPDGDRVIVTRNNADRLSTIDPARIRAGEVLQETRISAFALDADWAWGIDWMSGAILRLNRDTLAIVQKVPPLSQGQDGIVRVAGDLWVEGQADGGPVVHRVRPPDS
jgi:streptogramin lyase